MYKKNIMLLSGGKDSTAMLLILMEQKVIIDEVIFCDTGMEFPEMYIHLEKLKNYIDIPITTLSAQNTFEYYMFQHQKTKGKHKGKLGYGWPSGRINWCTKALKTSVSTRYLNKKYGKGNYIEFVGIAYDEFKRLDNKDKKTYPLAEMRITEGECLKYCYDRGFEWGGLYTRFDRVSCWCCPQSNKRELFMIYTFYPDLWEKLKDMDNRSWNMFKSMKSVDDFEKEFLEYTYSIKKEYTIEIKPATKPRTHGLFALALDEGEK